jgi:hypothetical protein
MSQNDLAGQDYRSNPYESATHTHAEWNADHELLTVLASTAKWQMLCALIGFVATAGFGLMLTIQLLAFRFAPAMVTGVGMVAVWTLMAGVPTVFFCLIPSMLLRRASIALRRFENAETGSLTDAFIAQRSFWRYLGLSIFVAMFFCASLIALAAVGGVAFLVVR